jgi:sugar/nucleoside kinase (ribokinase family)
MSMLAALYICVAAAATIEPLEETPASASVQAMVTQRMRGQLDMLGYSEAEIESLSPRRAAVVVERKLRRPRAGVPVSWTKTGEPVGGWLGHHRRRIGRVFKYYLPTTLAVACMARVDACGAGIQAAAAFAAALLQRGHQLILCHSQPQSSQQRSRQVVPPIPVHGAPTSPSHARGLYPWEPGWEAGK